MAYMNCMICGKALYPIVVEEGTDFCCPLCSWSESMKHTFPYRWSLELILLDLMEKIKKVCERGLTYIERYPTEVSIMHTSYADGVTADPSKVKEPMHPFITRKSYETALGEFEKYIEEGCSN